MIRVACIGDSITWGFTLLNPRKQSYPALLQEKLGEGYEVRNFGYNDAAARFDADTPYVRKRVYRNSLAWNPDIVLLMLGTNDTKTRNWDPDIFRRDYRRIIESYQALPSHPRVILIAPIRIFTIMGIPWLGVHPETMEEGVRPAIREIAGEMGLELIDLKDLFTDTQFCRDGVHPQRTGAVMLAEAVYKGVHWEKTMETRRIVLRPWRESDAESLFKYASDPEVGPRAGWPPHKTVEESLEIIRTVFGNDRTWAIELKETGEPVGCIGYFIHGESNIDIGENDAEAGYWVARPYWNQGICTEALRLMIDYCFAEKGFGAIWSDFFLDNPASGRVMEKCDFHDTGEINYCSRLQVGSDRPVKVMKLEAPVSH